MARTVLAVGGVGARTVLRRVLPIATLIVAVIVTSVVLPSLPASNPNVADAGLGPAAVGNATPGASAESPSPGATPSVLPSGLGPSAILSNGLAGPGSNPSLPPGVPCVTYQGVNCNTITVAWHWQEQTCGQDISALLAALGVTQDPRRVMPMLQNFFNNHLDEFFPDAHNYLKPGVHNFYGRNVQLFEENADGGTFCPQNAEAAASRINQGHAFAALGGCLVCNNQGSPQVMQPALSNRHIVSVENTQDYTSWYRAQAPYAWSPLDSADTIINQFGDFICNYLKDRPPMMNSDDAAYAQHPRVFTTTHVNEPVENQMAADIGDRIRGCGAHYGTDFQYNKDPSTAATQAATYNARVRQAHTTTTVTIADPIANQIGLNEDNATKWYHETLLSDFEFSDASSVEEPNPTGETQYMMAIEQGDGYTQSMTKFEDTWWGKLWRQTYGSMQPPSDLRTWAIVYVILARQLLVAGPNLTPEAIQQGMAKYSAPLPRENPPYSAQAGYGPNYPDGPWSGIKDFELLKFDPSVHSDYCAVISPSNHGNGAFMPLTNYPNFKDLGNLGWTRFRDWLRPS